MTICFKKNTIFCYVCESGNTVVVVTVVIDAFVAYTHRHAGTRTSTSLRWGMIRNDGSMSYWWARTGAHCSPCRCHCRCWQVCTIHTLTYTRLCSSIRAVCQLAWLASRQKEEEKTRMCMEVTWIEWERAPFVAVPVSMYALMIVYFAHTNTRKLVFIALSLWQQWWTIMNNQLFFINFKLQVFLILIQFHFKTMQCPWNILWFIACKITHREYLMYLFKASFTYIL